MWFLFSVFGKEPLYMKKAAKWVDTVIGFIFLHFGGLFTLAILLVVLMTIICRYVLHTSTGGLDEFSSYFVVSSVFAGAVLATRDLNEGPVKIDILDVLIKNRRVLNWIGVFWQVLSIAIMGVYTKLSFDYFTYQFQRGSTLSGIRFPMWIFTGFMTICAFFITIYELRRMVVLVKAATCREGRGKEGEK